MLLQRGPTVGARWSSLVRCYSPGWSSALLLMSHVMCVHGRCDVEKLRIRTIRVEGIPLHEVDDQMPIEMAAGWSSS